MQVMSTHLSEKMDRLEYDSINRHSKTQNELTEEVKSIKSRLEENITARLALVQADLSKNHLGLIEKVRDIILINDR